MKKFGILFMLLISLTVSAQSDFEIAQEFMSKKGVELVPNKRSATRGTDVPYSVFNGSEGKGFCIVLNGNVIGYDTNNTIDKNNMPCCLEKLLGSYTKKAKTRSNYTSDYTPDWWKPRNVTPIEPLITTRWGQTNPFNDILKEKGICAVIAWCQLLHYFRVPQTYEEKEGYPITTFNHDLMIDKYDYGKYTEEQAYEVARFVDYYYHLENPDKYYGVNVNTIFSDKDNHYKDADYWLEQNTPILTVGEHDGAGHCFLIDGRDSEGRYHVNLGWGGAADGYYVISDSDEHDRIYNGNSGVEDYMDEALWCFYTITPKLFTWEYTTDIHRITTNVGCNGVYNLQGIKMGNSLDGLPKGIYIQNGKKVLK